MMTKNSASRTSILLLMLFWVSQPMPSFAGGSGGNGGQSISCQSQHGDVTQAYDLFEGAELFGYSYQSLLSLSGLNSALELATRLDRSLPASGLSIQERVQRVAEQIEASPDTGALTLTTDISPFMLPVNCHLVQTLIFQADLSIQVDHIEWTHLPELSRAALYLHEAIYWYLRDLERDTNSLRTRRIVAFVLGGGSLELLRKNLTTYDPESTICQLPPSTFGPSADSLILTLDPAGGASMHVSGFQNILLRGKLSGASIFNEGAVSPTGTGRFEGTLDLGGGTKQNLLILIDSNRILLQKGSDRAVDLDCHRYI